VSYTTQAGATQTALSSRCSRDKRRVTVVLLGKARLTLADGSVVEERWLQTDLITRGADGSIAIEVTAVRLPSPGQPPARGVTQAGVALSSGPPATLTVAIETVIPCPDGVSPGASCAVIADLATERSAKLVTTISVFIVVRDAAGAEVSRTPVGSPSVAFSTDPADV
jgi:hypothetical protein